jgi:hypothetical protein
MLSSSPGATCAVIDARPSLASRIAESGEKRTTLGVNAGTLSTTSGRTDTGVGAGVGAGAD